MMWRAGVDVREREWTECRTRRQLQDAASIACFMLQGGADV